MQIFRYLIQYIARLLAQYSTSLSSKREASEAALIIEALPLSEAQSYFTNSLIILVSIVVY